jgi:hypothetical protein
VSEQLCRALEAPLTFYIVDEEGALSTVIALFLASTENANGCDGFSKPGPLPPKMPMAVMASRNRGCQRRCRLERDRDQRELCKVRYHAQLLLLQAYRVRSCVWCSVSIDENVSIHSHTAPPLSALLSSTAANKTVTADF